jgi:hypothetical protein
MSNILSKAYCPAVFNMDCLKLGFSYSDKFVFLSKTTGVAPPNLTGDTFSMPIKNAAGTTVATLTLGAGLSIGTATNELKYTITAPITAASGEYTYLLIWSRGGINPVPIVQGAINVSA